MTRSVWLNAILAANVILFSASSVLADDVQQLSNQDVEQCVQTAKEQFSLSYGAWILNRSESTEVRLNETQDEADIRIHYTWGSAKFARYFCSYKVPGRLVVNRAFAGPGSQ